jgi:hypothetical protein
MVTISVRVWISLFFAVLCSTLTALSQNSVISSTLTPHVDERVELLSIVFHLAENSTTNTNSGTPCLQRVDKYFNPYGNHPAVVYARKLVASKQIDLEEMMVLALALTEPPEITLRTQSSPDDRLTEEVLAKFIPLLRDFYRDSNFEQFYKTSKPVYDVAEARFSNLLNKNSLSWLIRFYGQKPGITLHLILDLNNGASNFDFRMQHEDKSLHQYTIIGCMTCANDGSPDYLADDNYLPTVMHDVNNSYIVPEVEGAWKKFESAPDSIYRAESVSMQTQGVGDAKAMIEESLLRAVTILTYEQSGEDKNRVLHRIRQEQGNGFVWMDKLVDQLRAYSQNSFAYPSFKEFMPTIVGFYRDLSPRMIGVKTEFAQRSAHVVNIAPFTNGAMDVDPTLTSITVTFDKPLDTAKNFSFSTTDDTEIQIPIGGAPTYQDGGTRVLIPLALQPRQHYAFELSSDSFETIDGFPLDTYRVEFKTR